MREASLFAAVPKRSPLSTHSTPARQVPVAMIWNSGGHGGYDSLPGECEVYGSGTTGLDQCYLTQRALAWFNRYLRGDTRVDTGPGFAYHRDWVAYDGSGSAHSQYGQAASFPAQAMQTFYLSGAADLVTEMTLVKHPFRDGIKGQAGVEF